MHLCPGRHLALDEILGFTSALVLGYEIEWLCADKVKAGRQMLANGIPKPAEDGDGGPAPLRRRKAGKICSGLSRAFHRCIIPTYGGNHLLIRSQAF